MEGRELVLSREGGYSVEGDFLGGSKVLAVSEEKRRMGRAARHGGLRTLVL